MPDPLEVIIPVHNGEKVIGATLKSLAEQDLTNVRVTLAFNGCSDASVEAARDGLCALRGAGAKVRTLVLSKGSRTQALNAADLESIGHRLYLDQDSLISSDAILHIRQRLVAGFHFIGLRAEWRTGSPVVRAAMKAWNEAPYVVRSPVTAGLYALSMEGRARWASFPDSLPDDKFARLHFSPNERILIRESSYSVEGAASFLELASHRRRYLRSNRQLRRSAPELFVHDLPRESGWRQILKKPASLPGLCVLTAAEFVAQVSVRP
jgi:glycosyltransferase involved in cell wall biosynthesis